MLFKFGNLNVFNLDDRPSLHFDYHCESTVCPRGFHLKSVLPYTNTQ